MEASRKTETKEVSLLLFSWMAKVKEDLKDAIHAVMIDPFLLGRKPLVRGRMYCGAGLYFVFIGESVVYIGVAKNIRSRWMDHHLWHLYKTELSTAFIAWTLPASPVLEFLLIHLHQPTWNSEIRKALSGPVTMRWKTLLDEARVVYANFEQFLLNRD